MLLKQRDGASCSRIYPGSTKCQSVCDLALAHVNDDRTEATYRRSDLFEKRRELMEDWAMYLDR